MCWSLIFSICNFRGLFSLCGISGAVPFVLLGTQHQCRDSVLTSMLCFHTWLPHELPEEHSASLSRSDDFF
jgi:hypothetical protein